MGRYACIDVDNIVQQVVLWDGVAEWAPPEGQTLVLLPDDDFFIAPRGTLDPKTLEFVAYEHTPEEIAEQRAAAELLVPEVRNEKSRALMDGLIDVLVTKGTITPEDVDAIDPKGITAADVARLGDV